MRYKIFGIGEVLWDLLPSGRQMGGAPANFAYHARALGADARALSRVGRDTLGDEMLQQFEKLRLPVDGIARDAEHPTGTVSVELAEDGQPSYVIHRDVAWDFLEASEESLRAMAGANAVCFGSLAQRSERSRRAIRKWVAHTPGEAVRVFDV